MPQPQRQNKPSSSFSTLLSAALATVLALTLLSGCGVVTDFVRDNQIRVGSLGFAGFVSPAKLKVGILPFRDEVGLGAPEAGSNLAVLLTEQFAENSSLTLVSASVVAQAVAAKGWTDELLPEQAVELGRELGLNVVIDGAISEIDQYSRRKGWRRLARYFTSQRTYVEAVLTITAYDAATGVVLSTRAGQADHQVEEEEEPDPFEPKSVSAPSQSALESSLDLAIEEAYYRVIDGLAFLPFKATVVRLSGGSAVIGFGTDVGLEKGQLFVRLDSQPMTNDIETVYHVPGPVKARLRVAAVGPDSAELEVLEGQVGTGEIVQSWED
jgi:hypothetical protein